MELRVLAHAMLLNKASKLPRENTYDHLPQYNYVYNKAEEAAKECEEEISRWFEQARHPRDYLNNADMLQHNVQFTTKTQGDMQFGFKSLQVSMRGRPYYTLQLTPSKDNSMMVRRIWRRK